MSAPNSNSPGMFEANSLLIDRVLGEVHTCTPAKVMAYDPSTQTATVQPTLQRVYSGQGPIDLPEIFEVPVVFPRVANAWLRLPIAAGDLVMLHFTERSLDKWSQGDGSTTIDPGVPHRFHLSDAVATPGLYPQGQALQGKGQASSIELVNGLGWLEISPTGQFKLSNGTVSLMTVLDNILTHLQSLTTVGGPTTQTISPATVAILAADQAQLEALKL